METRPDILQGKTIKVKPAISEHAYYITVNFLNGKPLELFINSKDVTYFDWIIAFTRTFSALLRKEQDIKFLLDELKDIKTPNGGYFVKINGKSKNMGSLTANIAYAIELLLEN